MTPAPSMAFQLDTSGTVFGCGPDGRVRWSDLSPFEQGFVEAALESVVIGLRKPCAFRDLHADTLARFLEDCRARVRHCPSEGRAHRNFGPRVEQNGARFWQWRQAGQTKNFPPLRLSFSPEGKVICEEVKS